MRILIVTPNPPYPPQQGAALRNFGIIHSLAQAGAKITLLTFCDTVPDSPPDRLAALCERIEYLPAPPRSVTDRLRDVALTDLPDLARRLHSAEFRDRLTALLRDNPFDLIQFEGLEVAAYALHVKSIQPAIPLIYDAHNAEFALQRNIAQVEGASIRRIPHAVYSRIQSQRITRFERRICQTASAVIAVSDDDAAHLRSLGTKTPVHTLPNGIFVDDYAKPAPALHLTGKPIVFTGKMDYRPNVDAMLWFAEDILPGILEKHADVHLYVVGQAVHRNLLQLEENTSKIAFTRWVESVQPFLHGAEVFVAPLRMGSGTRLKILEAMAAGCAIVATTVAISGLREGVRDALIVADNARDFVNAVNRLLADNTEQARLRKDAYDFVRACYDWSVLAPQLLNIYAELGVG